METLLLVKFFIFFGLSKYVRMPPFWFMNKFNKAWDRHATANQEHDDSVFRIFACVCINSWEICLKKFKPGVFGGM